MPFLIHYVVIFEEYIYTVPQGIVDSGVININCHTLI